jgi:hypothetical protein
VKRLRTAQEWNDILGFKLNWFRIFENCNDKVLPAKWCDLQYRVISHGLPLMKRLNRENPALSADCPSCRNGEETDLHFLWECERSQAVWKACNELLKSELKYKSDLVLRDVIVGQPVPSRWWRRTSRLKRCVFRACLAAARWAIWVQRNKFLLNADPPDFSLILNIFLSGFRHWRSTFSL